jgi:long-chain fatty acid transport protein
MFHRLSLAALPLFVAGTPDIGTASAGRAALAMDASTAWGNPAGMTLLTGTQLMVGFQPSYFETEFEASPATSTTGGNGGNATGFIPFASVFVTRKLNPDFSLGLAIASNFEQTLEYEEGWAGRYYSVRDNLRAVTLNPSVGMRLEHYLSFGAGLDVVFGSMNKTVAVNNAAVQPGVPDGQLTADDRAVGIGVNVGLLLEPEGGARIGLTYRSPTTLGFEDIASASGIGDTLQAVFDSLGVAGKRVDSDVSLPQEALLSLYHPFNDIVAVMLNSGWQRWEEFGTNDVTLSDATSTTDLTVNRATEDTWHFAAGLHYRVDPRWLVQGGFAYDTAASTDGNRSVDLPLDTQYRFSGGATLDVDDVTAVSFGYLFADLGNAPVSRNRTLPGRLVGEYATHRAHFLSLSLNRTY